MYLGFRGRFEGRFSLRTWTPRSTHRRARHVFGTAYRPAGPFVTSSCDLRHWTARPKQVNVDEEANWHDYFDLSGQS